MKTEWWAVLGVIVCSFLTSFAQLFWKLGIDKTVMEPISLLTSWNLLAGLILYGIGAVILLFSFKRGDLSVLYPFLALSFIWVSLLSLYFLNESISLVNWGGVLAIVGGVSMIGKGVGYE